MQRIISACLVLILSGALVMTITAAPILPSSSLKDQVRSLHGIEKLRVHLEPLSSAITDLDVDADELVARQRRKLRQAGFEIVSEAQATDPGPVVPRLTIEITGVGDQQVAGALACTISVTLEQQARIERLDKELFLPTFARHATALVPEAEVSKTIRQTTFYLVDQFADWSRLTAAGR
ncbi:MAG: hypothetical protein CMJ18_24590 [Phycisphaeraceae bacterium]|nr:hypothetical protein [Phycisphaeraceae bacterium]